MGLSNLKNGAKVKVESEGLVTKVYIDGKKLENVTRIAFEQDIDKDDCRSIPRVNVTFQPSEAEINGVVSLIKNEPPKGSPLKLLLHSIFRKH